MLEGSRCVWCELKECSEVWWREGVEEEAEGEEEGEAAGAEEGSGLSRNSRMTSQFVASCDESGYCIQKKYFRFESKMCR